MSSDSNVIENKYENARRALKALNEIMQEEFSVIVRDAAIQRFEFTVEAFWKYVQIYLLDRHGIRITSPKACMRGLLSSGKCDEETTVKALDMIDDRNLTSHTYHEEVAIAIYQKLSGYLQLMKRLLDDTDPSGK